MISCGSNSQSLFGILNTSSRYRYFNIHLD